MAVSPPLTLYLPYFQGMAVIVLITSKSLPLRLESVLQYAFVLQSAFSVLSWLLICQIVFEIPNSYPTRYFYLRFPSGGHSPCAPYNPTPSSTSPFKTNST